MKLVINTCYGGFDLSDKAYERLIELGIPVKKYERQERDPETGLFDNSKVEKVIYDRSLTPRGEDPFNDMYHDNPNNSIVTRYWETWLRDERDNPLLVQVVEELGEEANTKVSELKVIEIPDDVEYEIDYYDGIESVHEKHQSWS